MTIRPLREDDAASARDVERDAGRLFLAVGMPEIAYDDPPGEDTLAAFAAAGRAWACEVDGELAAYLLLDVVDGAAHVEQVSVRAAYARRRLGLALLETAADWARQHGMSRMTLTTFRDVPWNAPYYAALGFRELPEDEYGPELRALVAREVAHGLWRWPRLAMVKDTGT